MSTSDEQMADALAVERKAVAEAARVRELLEAPVMRDTLSRLHADYFVQFKNATTPEAALDFWRRSRALEELVTDFTRTMDNGVRASAAVQRHDEREQMRKAREAEMRARRGR